MGDYSEACILKSNETYMRASSLFLLFVDFCTVPYSYTVGTYDNGKMNFSRYTESNGVLFRKLSSFGLLLNANSVEDDPRTRIVRLFYVDELYRHHKLFDRNYGSHLGAMCYQHNCSTMEETKDAKSKFCVVPWIDYQNETQFADMKVTFFKCTGSQFKVNLIVLVEGSKRLISTSYLDLSASKEDVYAVGEIPAVLQLGYSRYERNSGGELEDGYLLLDFGNVTLYARRGDNDVVNISVRRLFLL